MTVVLVEEEFFEFNCAQSLKVVRVEQSFELPVYRCAVGDHLDELSIVIVTQKPTQVSEPVLGRFVTHGLKTVVAGLGRHAPSSARIVMLAIHSCSRAQKGSSGRQFE